MARWAILIGGLLVFLVTWRVTVLCEFAPWVDFGVRGLGFLSAAVICAELFTPSQVRSESEVSRLRADVESLRAEVQALRSQIGG